MYQPNGYLWKYTSEMYDLPLTGGQLLYESDTVPFLQIVLNGSADLFSAPVNTADVLRIACSAWWNMAFILPLL